MSAEFWEHPGGWEPFRNALAEIRASRAEFEEFFGNVSDELGTLSSELGKRQRGWQQEYLDRAAQEQCQQETTAATENHQLKQTLEEAQREQALFQQERALLESELEAVRNRAAEVAESLAEQKRQASGEQEQWAGELKRMRSLLEKISQRLLQVEVVAAAPRSAPTEPVAVANQTLPW